MISAIIVMLAVAVLAGALYVSWPVRWLEMPLQILKLAAAPVLILIGLVLAILLA